MLIVLQTPTRRIYKRTVRPGFKLRITRTSGPPIHHLLTSANTTACLNFFTWNKAYSIFPQHTLVQHRFYPLKFPNDEFGSTLNELADQGWSARDIVWPDLAGAEICKIQGLRRVGGSSTMVILLNTDSVRAAAVPDSEIEYAQFDVLGADARDNPLRGSQRSLMLYSRVLKIHAEKNASAAMRHDFITGHPGWQAYLRDRLRRWAWLEFYKLRPEDRPHLSGTAHPLHSELSLPQNFRTPPSWDYADDAIPVWYKEWEQTGNGHH